MPIYEFRCSAGHLTEHTFASDAIPAGAICTCGLKARRLYSAPMVPVLDEYDQRFRRRRRSNPGDAIAREHDPTVPAPRGHDTKPRQIRAK